MNRVRIVIAGLATTLAAFFTQAQRLEAISIGTLNGATYLGRDKTIGSITIGQQADLMIVNGDPSTTVADIRRVETVLRQGIGFEPAKLIQSVTGRVGLW